MRLLIIESDLVLLALLLDNLPKYYLLDVASSWSKALGLLRKNSYQGLLGNWSILKHDWLEFWQIIQQSLPMFPLLILLEEKEPSLMANPLPSYPSVLLRKPFSVEELQERLQLIFSNSWQVETNKNNYQPTLNLNIEERQLAYLDQKMFLSAKECALLSLLMKHPQQILSKMILAHLLWANEEVAVGNSIEQHISGLRRKLKFLTGKNLIKTIRGVGYCYCSLD